MKHHQQLEVNLLRGMYKFTIVAAIQSIYSCIYINFDNHHFINRFEHTWPAMSYKLNGTIFVYNPEDKKHAEELNLWYFILKKNTINSFSIEYNIHLFIFRYNNFVEKPNLNERCCLLVASKKNQDEEDSRSGHDVPLCKIFCMIFFQIL